MAKNDDERIEAFERRGPAPRDLDSEERTRFLRLIQGGLGVHLALEHIGIGHARYKRTLANDPDFDAEVKHSLACRRERLASLAYKLAAGNKEEGREPDIFLLKFMINRDDQAERYREEQREKRRLAKLVAEATRSAAALIQGADADDRRQAAREHEEWREEIRRRAGGGSSSSSVPPTPPT